MLSRWLTGHCRLNPLQPSQPLRPSDPQPRKTWSSGAAPPQSPSLDCCPHPSSWFPNPSSSADAHIRASCPELPRVRAHSWLPAPPLPCQRSAWTLSRRPCLLVPSPCPAVTKPGGLPPSRVSLPDTAPSCLTPGLRCPDCGLPRDLSAFPSLALAGEPGEEGTVPTIVSVSVAWYPRRAQCCRGGVEL